MVVAVRARGEGAGRGERDPESDGRCGARPPGERDGDERQQPGDDCDGERSVRDADQHLDLLHAREDRRVILPVRGDVARQRRAHGEEQQPQRERRHDLLARRVPAQPDAEGERNDRDERH